MTFKIKGLPEHWQGFGVCVVLHMCLPALPLAVEYLATDHIEDQSLVLFTSLYALTIGTSSRSQLLFVLAIIAGLFFSIAYGFALGSGEQLNGANEMAKISIFVFFVVHLIERFNLHVGDRTPFLEFFKKEG